MAASALLVMALAPPARADTHRDRPHIVMIVIDTLRADHLGCYGYDRDTSPRIDALAERGVRFDRCYSTSSWTLPAVASLLSGTYPTRHGATTWTGRVRDDVPWLVALLQDAGYHTMGVSSNPFLTSDHGFDRGFDTFDDETVLAAAEWSFPLLESKHKALVLASTSATATRRAMQLLNEAPDDQPLFLLVHYMDPHADYLPPSPPEGPEAPEGSEPPAARFDPDYEGSITGHVQSENISTDISERDLAHIKALYDGEIAHVDRYVGQLLDHLDAMKLRDQTAVVLTADHGEELLDHGGWFHGHTLYEEAVRVPLIVDWPGRGQRGRAVPEPVSLVDVMPTMLELLGEPTPAEVHGRSLAEAMAGEPLEAAPLLMQTRLSGRLAAAVVGRDKVIAYTAGRGGDLVLDEKQHFDLGADPAERDAKPDDPQAAERMAELLIGLLRRYDASAAGAEPVEQADLERQQLQRLRELGYVGSEHHEP